MSIFVEGYNYTRGNGIAFDDVEVIRDYFDKFTEDEVTLDHIEVNGIVCNLNEFRLAQQLQQIEELECIEGKDLDFIMQVKKMWNYTLQEAMTQVYEGYRTVGETKLKAFIEFYDDINHELINSVPEPLKGYIDYESLLTDREIDTWEIYNVGNEYLFIFK